MTDVMTQLRQAAPFSPDDVPDLPADLRQDMARTIMSGSTPDHLPARASHRRRTLVAAGLVGIGALVATSLTMVDSSPNAFAGWRSVPTVITGPAAQTLAASCRHNLTSGQAGVPKDLQLPGAAGDRLAIAERRGIFTLTVISSPGANGYSCLRGKAGKFLGGGGQGIDSVGQPVARQVSEFGGAGSDDGKGHEYMVDAGRYGAGVRGVEVVLRDGASITAAVHNGFWSAWWPSWERPESFVLRLSDGSTVRQPEW